VRTEGGSGAAACGQGCAASWLRVSRDRNFNQSRTTERTGPHYVGSACWRGTQPPPFPCRRRPDDCFARTRPALVLAELGSHAQEKLAIGARHTFEHLHQPLDRFPRADLFRHLGRTGLALSMKQDLIRFDLQCLGELLQGRKGGGGISAFYTRYVRTQETRPSFDVTLRQALCFAQRS